jgi:hypothetical protein
MAGSLDEGVDRAGSQRVPIRVNRAVSARTATRVHGNIPLVTQDQAILQGWPGHALSLEAAIDFH